MSITHAKRKLTVLWYKTFVFPYNDIKYRQSSRSMNRAFIQIRQRLDAAHQQCNDLLIYFLRKHKGPTQ